MSIYCTISTFSHLFKAFALADSLAVFQKDLKVLLIDGDVDKLSKSAPNNITFFSLTDLISERANAVKAKYKEDYLRWALKPVFLLHLLSDYSSVIYVDNDIYFFNDSKFLEDYLLEYNILLTPHFYPSEPNRNQTWLEANFRIGLFNAGFIGVNTGAKKALEWWADCCLYELRKAYWRGLFDDQKYLDLFPILFEKVKIIKDRGCNLAGWNSDIILKMDKIIFIHFNEYTINKFKNTGNPYFAFFYRYKMMLRSHGFNKESKTLKLNKFKLQNFIYFIRWKISRLH